MGDDVATGALAIGFPFKFYGKTYTQTYLSSNGMLSFEAPHIDYANTPVPWNRDSPRAFVAAFWDDLVVGGAFNSGKVQYRATGNPGSRTFVATWSGVTRQNSPGNPLTFQIVLFEDGGINISYSSLSGVVNRATAGIEDSFGEDGLQVTFNAVGPLAGGKSIYFNYPPPQARAHLRPAFNSRLTSAGETESFNIRIRNTADDAADRYVFSTTGSAWPVSIMDANGSALPEASL